MQYPIWVPNAVIREIELCQQDSDNGELLNKLGSLIDDVRMKEV